MANKLSFGEGASINRTPLLCGENYQLWKIIMKIVFESIDRKILDAITMVLLFLCVEKIKFFLKTLVQMD